MKVAVIGSRGFKDYKTMVKVLDAINITEVVSSGAKGADKLAEKYAQERGLPLKLFLPLHQTDPATKYHVKWFFVRNCELVDYSDQVVAFWDGLSKGTRFTIDYARKQGKPVLIPETEPRP